MRRLLLCLACALALAGCGVGASEPTPPLTVAVTTYPAYLFTTAVTDGAQVEVQLMVEQSMSCLHDYTLTMEDMKLVERADVIVISGAGLEDFLDQALAQSAAPVVDCSAGMELLPARGHDHHDGHGEEGHWDPHYWLSLAGARCALNNIAQELSRIDPSNAELYAQNLESALEQLGEPEDLSGLECPYLITFHDGFSYFARECGLELLKSIEEEEGAQASARDLREVLSLIRTYRVPAIFVEVNGVQTTARAIARESGVEVAALDLVMSGQGRGLDPYLAAMEANRESVRRALSAAPAG